MLKSILHIAFVCFFGLHLSSQTVFNKVYNDFSQSYVQDSMDIPWYSFYKSESFLGVVELNSNSILAVGGSYPDFVVDSFQFSVYLTKVNTVGDTVSKLLFETIPYSRNGGFHLIPLSDESIYLFGITSNSVYDSIYNQEGLIMKLDSSLNVLWFKTPLDLGPNEQLINAKYIEELNSFYTLSYAHSDSINGNYDAFLSKMDTSGNLLYTHSFGGLDSDFMYDLAYMHDGTFILSGTTYSNTAGTLGRTDVWVMRVDTLGNVLWDERFGYPGWDEASSLKNLIVHSDAIYIVGGHEKSDGDDVGWFLKLNLQGDTLWTKMYNRGVEFERLYNVESWDDNTLIFSGASINYDFITDYKPLAWVLKMNTYGEIIWERFISMYPDDPDADTYLYDMFLASDGGILLAGYVINNQIQSNGINHRNDAWMAKTDSCGFTAGAMPQADFIFDSIVGPQVYISNLSEDYCIGSLEVFAYNPATGDTLRLDSLHVYAYSQYTNGDDPNQWVYTLPDTGSYIFTLYTYAGDGEDVFNSSIQVSDISTNITDAPSIAFSVYPNPAKDYVVVEGRSVLQSTETAFQVQFYNMTGQLVHTTSLNPRLYQERLYIGDLSNGVYLMRFMVDDQVVGYERVSVVK